MTPQREIDRLRESAEFVRAAGGEAPEVAVVWGSGFGELGSALEVSATWDYEEVPHFFSCSTGSHSGVLQLGRWAGRSALVYRGRFHLYEGYSAKEVVRPVRLASLLGARTLVLTAATGGIQPNLRVGDLLLLRDHLNFSGHNPLVGPADGFEPRFVDLTHTYAEGLRAIAQEAAQQAFSGPLAEGVYGSLLGPSYETPAEIRFLRAAGADVVGMSVVMEAIAARQAGMDVLGIASITNLAAGLGGGTLSHEEVLAVGREQRQSHEHFFHHLLRRLGPGTDSDRGVDPSSIRLADPKGNEQGEEE